MIRILKVVNGSLDENCYIVNDGEHALIIDPGSESDKIQQVIDNNNLDVLAILITHYHFDHVGELNYFKEKYPSALVIDHESSEEQTINDFKFKIIKNYGHTLDSCSFYFEKDKSIFTGDFIFKGSIGKFDEINRKLMFDNLHKFKENIPLDTKIYPGHYDSTNMKNEIFFNMFLRGI